MDKIIEDLIVTGYIIFEEVEEDIVSEYNLVDDNLADVNDNIIAYSITPNIINTDLNFSALKPPLGDRQPLPRPQVDA
jgi:hypothetical protein